MQLIDKYFPNVVGLQDEFIQATIDTIYMVIVTAIIAGILGIILGTILTVTDKKGIFENKWIYTCLDKTINILRSIPFIVMLAAIVPFTRLIVGTSIGTTASIVPLVIGTTPFFARQIQNALLNVDSGVIEASIAMGFTPNEIIFRVYLKEGLVGMIRASILTIINLIGLTTMAGAVGGGGLGNLAIIKGYNRFQTDVTIVAIIIILILVFISQIIGDYFIKRLTH